MLALKIMLSQDNILTVNVVDDPLIQSQSHRMGDPPHFISSHRSLHRTSIMASVLRAMLLLVSNVSIPYHYVS